MQLRTFYLCTILQSRQKESVKVHQNIILSIGLYRCKMLIYSERTKIGGIWKLKCWGDEHTWVEEKHTKFWFGNLMRRYYFRDQNITINLKCKITCLKAVSFLDSIRILLSCQKCLILRKFRTRKIIGLDIVH